MLGLMYKRRVDYISPRDVEDSNRIRLFKTSILNVINITKISEKVQSKLKTDAETHRTNQ